MNDPASGPENKALTYEEALQVLRLSPDGLRRLADLDEAITELESARRSLLANRLESIRDAFDVARKAREVKDSGNGEHEESLPPENEAHSSSQNPTRRVSMTRSSSPTLPTVPGSLAEFSKSPDRRQASEALSLQADLRGLRAELAELRQEVAGLKRSRNNGSDGELQQVQRRLSYLEAEIESREI